MSLLALAGYRAADDAVLLGPTGAIGAAVFFAQAARLARALPEGTHVINLCETRHGFMLGFAAALMRAQVSLLPPSRGRADWEALLDRYPGAYVLSEKPLAGANAFELGAILGERTLDEPVADALDIPCIDSATVAAILFTSGSTGEPGAHSKTWGQLCAGARLFAGALGWGERPAVAIVGSVPPQHMFGLESTVMLPLQAGVAVHAHEPLLAADLETALRECGRPAWWMTTAMLLRAPLQAGALPGLQGLVASTMSLPAELARAAEDAWRIPVIELYGSTETGALATRRTASEIAWTPLPGVALHAQGAGDAQRFRAEGPHIDTPVVLGDVFDLQPDGRFRWLGRTTDLVKVGGKRASLFVLNRALTQIPGVEDGVFAFPPEARAQGDESHPARRLAAFFVSETLDSRQVLAALRERIDPTFLPRPLHRVERLPRNANGKLTQAALAELFAQCQPAQAIGAGHPALPGHFPGDPRVPGVTLLARVAEALCTRFPHRAPGELLHARFHSALRPGEPFAIEAREEEGRARFVVRRAGLGETADTVIASGEWALKSAAPAAPRA
jgi:acyl-CoA synthetase (AMP-forming)/AMP-acid ligase II